MLNLIEYIITTYIHTYSTHGKLRDNQLEINDPTIKFADVDLLTYIPYPYKIYYALQYPGNSLFGIN